MPSCRSTIAQTAGTLDAPSALNPHIRPITGAEAAIILAATPCCDIKTDDRAPVEYETSYVVDVRAPEKYAEKHIAGALSIPLDTIEAAAPAALPDKTAIVIVYCTTGKKSAAAAEKLAAMGYTRLRDLGPMTNWTGPTAP